MIRALWLATELLHPLNKGGRIRTYNTLRHLRDYQHVTYLTLDDGTADPDALMRASEYAHETIAIKQPISPKFGFGFYVDLLLNLASSRPYAAAKYRSPEVERACVQLLSSRKPDLLVCDFLAASVNMPERKTCPSVLFQHNVEATIWRRHFETDTNPAKRAFLRHQWRKMARFERTACQRFDQVIAVSHEDAEVIRRDYGVRSVVDVPTGVDTDYFRPGTTIAPDPFELVFTGSMDWLPNGQGILHFIDKILPRIRAQFPSVRMTVVGRSPPGELFERTRSDSRLIVTGRVDDVRPYIERSAVYVVPLYVGGGTRIKIYEAMAMERAVVSTRLGAEGLPLEDGRHILLADGDAEFAQSVCRLLRDADEAKRIGRAAAEYVRANFAWASVAKKFALVCEETVRRANVSAARESTSLLPVES